MSAQNEELLNAVRYYQDSLDKYSSIGNNYKVLSIIKKLTKLPIATSHLEVTGIGRTVNALRKLGGDVGDASKALVTKWKEMVVQEDVQPKDDADRESSELSLNSDKRDEIENTYINTKGSRKEDSSSHRSSEEIKHIDKHKYNSEKNTGSGSKNYHGKRDDKSKDADKHKNDYDSSTSEKHSSKTKQRSSDSESEEEDYKKLQSKRRGNSSDEDEEKFSSDEEISHNKQKKDVHKSNSSRNRSSEKKEVEKSPHKKPKYEDSERHSSKRKHNQSSSSELDEDDDGSDMSDSKTNRTDSDDGESRNGTNKHKKDKDKSSSGQYKASGDKKENRHKERSDKKQESSSKSHSSKRRRSSSGSESETDNYKKHSKSDSKHRDDSKTSSSKSKSKNKTEHKTHDNSSTNTNDETKSASKHKKNSVEIGVQEKSKNEKESRSHSSHSEKHEKKDRDKADSKDKHSHKKDGSSRQEEKPKNSKDEGKDGKKEKKATSTSSKSKENSKSNSSKDKPTSEKKIKVKTEPVNKEKIVHGIGSESGASFAEALGMCGPVPVISNKTASSSKKKSSSQSSPGKQSKSTSSSAPTKTERPEAADEKYVPSLLKEQPLQMEPLPINISSLLPEISPNYKPMAFPLDTQPKKLLTPDEALSQAISNKNMRTKVYSGNKIKGGEVESLFNICIKILQDNLDAMECTGGVPYSILKQILEKATPDQLFNMEHHNPYLIEDTDELWRLHCLKEFRTKKREEMETWREMYMRCLDEREAKLNAITANIKQSQDKSLPVRTTKLAYVDSVAKPPRNIARKQAKNGIVSERSPTKTPTSRLAALATSGEASKVSVPNPGSRAADRSGGGSSSSAMKPKKAPLMAKTLSLFKNRFKR